MKSYVNFVRSYLGLYSVIFAFVAILVGSTVFLNEGPLTRWTIVGAYMIGVAFGILTAMLISFFNWLETRL